MDKNLNVKSRKLEFLENNMGDYLECRVMSRFIKEQIPTNLKKIYEFDYIKFIKWFITGEHKQNF